jgi:hypothetical protein
MEALLGPGTHAGSPCTPSFPRKRESTGSLKDGVRALALLFTRSGIIISPTRNEPMLDGTLVHDILDRT